ncbi:MAG TPA: RNA polymerase sigma factor [Vicinamibacterales bacterium]|nr:RNA polymerase sigma factor [Vicinamibacterales bacterium]
MSDPDRGAIREVRAGDRNAFGRLVERYQGRLFGLVVVVLRDRAAAEEVTQDAFVRAYMRLDRYDERLPFYPWLATIAVRLAQNRLHQQGRTLRREGTPLDSDAGPGAERSPLSTLIAEERSRRLRRAVGALSSGERTAVMLYYADELPVREVARALGVSTGTIKTLLFRARRHLREMLT